MDNNKDDTNNNIGIFEALTKQQQEAVKLRAFGYSLRDIAAVINVSKSTVGNWNKDFMENIINSPEGFSKISWDDCQNSIIKIAHMIVQQAFKAGELSEARRSLETLHKLLQPFAAEEKQTDKTIIKPYIDLGEIFANKHKSNE